MNRYERIERLLYFREWAIALAYKTQKKEYFRMMIDTWKKLVQLRLIASDACIENPRSFRSQIEKIIGFTEIIEEKRKYQLVNPIIDPIKKYHQRGKLK